MWADNESELDLLGFEYLVDSLEIILTDPALLPVTVGVTGDWGSGKSSLMKMAQQRLDSLGDEKFITASFSPWRFDGYEDIKSALVETVLSAIEARMQTDEGLRNRVGDKLTTLRKKLHEWRVAGHIARAGALVAGAGPTEAAAAGAAADALVAVTEPSPVDEGEIPKSFKAIAEFHTAFEELVSDFGDDIQAIVVFIDDVDRCTAPAIVDTFEAVRLFLHAPKTAYVVGANEQIVEAALRMSLPAKDEKDELLGKSYLEKMLQISIVIPPLSEPEVLTYISLLFAERESTNDQFTSLLEAAEQQRHANQLGVAMNEGIAKDAIGELTSGLTDSLKLAHRVGPSLARGLRGNPRQVKRFLNTFTLRLKASERRGVELDPGVLAKLMVLEFIRTSSFEQLFQWQLESEESIPQLAVAEKLAKGDNAEGIDAEVEAWVLQPGVKRWLLLAPQLGDLDLRKYFTFTRDRISRSFLSSQLPSTLQKLSNALQSDLEPTRIKAVADVKELEGGEFSELIPVLLESAADDPAGKGMASLVEIGSAVPAIQPAIFAMLGAIPIGRVPATLPVRLKLSLAESESLDPLLASWEADGSRQLKSAATEARK